MTKFVAYYRVSRDSQGADGYGIDAQHKAVGEYLAGRACLAAFTEVETGTVSDRPQLAKALDACRKRKATLVIAKLDRLGRNVHFISGLMESKVPFVAADMPTATPFMLHVYAAVAEEEVRMIRARTRAALAAAKERGVVLGNPTLPAMNAAQQAASAERARALLPAIEQTASLSATAAAVELNRRGVKSATGAPWSAKTVIRLRERAAAL
jgi:DNA invertase Pin-like site-specific DNA recombinase